MVESSATLRRVIHILASLSTLLLVITAAAWIRSESQGCLAGGAKLTGVVHSIAQLQIVLLLNPHAGRMAGHA